jgi:hypothetical protein
MAIPVLNHMDFGKSAEIRNVILHKTGSGDVTSPGDGQIIYDSGVIKYYKSSTTEWLELGTSGGSVTSVAIAGTDGIDVDSGSPITGAGTITLGLSNIANDKLANSSITLTQGAGMGTLGSVSLGGSITVAVDGVLEDLDSLGAPASDGQFIVATGAGAFAYESGDTAIASLGITATGAELNVLDGITSTTAELNILDGVTATASELNILDGVTATTSELNILDGVTSTATELNLLDGVTGTLVTEAGTQTLTNKTFGDDITISSAVPEIVLTDTTTNADARISADSSAGSLTISADFNNEATTTKMGFLCDGKEVGRFRGDNSQIGSLRLFPLRSDNAAQGIFFGTNATEPGLLGGTFTRAISFSTGNKLHLYPGSTTASASVPLAISSSGAIEGTSIKDEDNMSSNSATHLATQQSIKAYVDDKTGQANLNTELGNITENVTIGDANDVQVTIAGDLVVSGTTTTVNSTTVNLNDHNIVLDSGNNTAAVVNGAGITIEGGSGDDATFTYNTTGPKFELKLGTNYEDLQVDGIIAASLTLGGTAVTSTAAELNILDGVTATASEINILDGVTSTTAELNILDGVTSTAAEINKLDGFTGVVADLNYAKDLRATGVTTTEFNVLDGITATVLELNLLDGVTATTNELNILDGVTATASEINILDGVTATTSELNILDGVTATAAELNYSDGVTSNIQTQLDAKEATANKLTKKLSGDGSATTYNIVHNFGTPIVMVQVLDYGDNGTGASYDVVQVEVQRNDDNSVDLIFAAAPSTSQDYLVLISKFPAIS